MLFQLYLKQKTFEQSENITSFGAAEVSHALVISMWKKETGSLSPDNLLFHSTLHSSQLDYNMLLKSESQNKNRCVVSFSSSGAQTVKPEVAEPYPTQRKWFFKLYTWMSPLCFMFVNEQFLNKGKEKLEFKSFLNWEDGIWV